MKFTNHIWACQNCETRLYLRVDSDKPEDLVKLQKFNDHISKHCIEKEHCVIHKEKGDFNYKYV